MNLDERIKKNKDWREIIKAKNAKEEQSSQNPIIKLAKAYSKYDYEDMVKYSEQILRSQKNSDFKQSHLVKDSLKNGQE